MGGRGVGQMSITIGPDTLMPNKKIYKPFVPTDETRINYFRKDGAQIFEYSSLDSSEFLRYDFSKQAGDTISSILRANGYGPSLFIFVSDQMELLFNESRRVLSFRSEACCDENDIADSIGVTFFKYVTDIDYYLNGAIISGKTYGNTSAVNFNDRVTPVTPTLSQNYPNPFNPSTTIHYVVPNNTDVTIVITNELGQHIAILVNAYKPAGSYNVEWNASASSSGSYFCTMNCGNFNKTLKLILLK